MYYFGTIIIIFLITYLVRKGFHGQKALFYIRLLLTAFLGFAIITNFLNDPVNNYNYSLWDAALRLKNIAVFFSLSLLAINIFFLLKNSFKLYLIAAGLYFVNFILFCLTLIPESSHPLRNASSLALLGYIIGILPIIISAFVLDPKMLISASINRNPFKMSLGGLIINGTLFVISGLMLIGGVWILLSSNGKDQSGIFVTGCGVVFGLASIFNAFPKFFFPKLKTQVNNELKTRISSLLPYSVFFIGIGSFFVYAMTIYESKWPVSIYAIPLRWLGALIAYWLVNVRVPGGNVIISFNEYPGAKGTNFMKTEGQKLFSDLIAKYRAKTLITLSLIVYLLIELFFTLFIFKLSNSISLDELLGSFMLNLLGFGLLLSGIKYISAWWNIRNNY